MLDREVPGDLDRELLGLPTRLGGLGLINPTALSDEFEASTRVTAPLTALIAIQNNSLGDSVIQQRSVQAKVRQESRQCQNQFTSALYSNFSRKLQRSIDLAEEKVSSLWLETLPLSQHGFHLSKSEFGDAVCLRYE